MFSELAAGTLTDESTVDIEAHWEVFRQFYRLQFSVCI
jgi:hypothetical protein